MIDEDEYDIIEKVICDYDISFQPGSFGGTHRWMYFYHKQILTCIT